MKRGLSVGKGGAPQMRVITIGLLMVGVLMLLVHFSGATKNNSIMTDPAIGHQVENRKGVNQGSDGQRNDNHENVNHETVSHEDVSPDEVARVRMAHNPQILGRLDSQWLPEISGAVQAGASPTAWWVLNDGGQPAELLRLLSEGTVSHRAKIVGHRNRDWEDLTHFTWQGQSYFLIADTGDNDAKRREVALIIVPKPNIPTQHAAGSAPAKRQPSGQPGEHLAPSHLRLRAARRIRIQYPDGARDVEAVAVDQLTQQILFLSKRDAPPRLYSLSLRKVMTLTASEARKIIITPRFETTVSAIADHFKTPLFSALLGFAVTRPTGMDAIVDEASGVSRFVILTYSYLYIFDKTVDESYAQAFAKKPRVRQLRKLPQAEALALTRDGRAVTVFSEGLATPILQWTLPAFLTN